MIKIWSTYKQRKEILGIRGSEGRALRWALDEAEETYIDQKLHYYQQDTYQAITANFNEIPADSLLNITAPVASFDEF